ncbi:hypothetical protein K492DRAFT_197732 [Lichtheimia hyalospora FSU 10163]|nr:hypothetical protein K492DRAFT_197732 [Lichtheimia hyalospora FSU 10163]
MAAGDWFEYSDDDIQARSSMDSVNGYQIHQEDEIKEYELPPAAATATRSNGVVNGCQYDNSEYDGHMQDMLSSSSHDHPVPTQRSSSFFSRLTSIPIVQDSLSGAQKTMEQHALGRLAGRTLSALYNSTVPYVNHQSRWSTQLQFANDMGHRSLDLLEQQCPLIVNGSSKDLAQAPHLVADEIRCRISSTVRKIRAPASIGLVMDNLEAVLDQYFPADESDNDEEDLIDPKDGKPLREVDEEEDTTPTYYQLLRVYRIANSLSGRIARRITLNLHKRNKNKDENSTGGEEEEARMSQWLVDQMQMLLEHLEAYKSQLPEPVQSLVVQPLIQLAHQEYAILQQELEKPGLTPVERARNVLAVSQDTVIMPLLQRSVQSMHSQVIFYRSLAQENRAHVMNELSSKLPILASLAPMSALASHYKSTQKEAATPTEAY